MGVITVRNANGKDRMPDLKRSNLHFINMVIQKTSTGLIFAKQTLHKVNSSICSWFCVINFENKI